jgi:valyl-tRNA synthetase
VETARKESASIKSLSGKGVKEIEVLGPDAPRPAGCVAFPVSSLAAVFLYVKGRVDMDAEIAKAQKKLDKTKTVIDKQRKIFDDPSYKEKVSEAVQESDRKRLLDLESEARGFEGTIKQFEQIKLE